MLIKMLDNGLIIGIEKENLDFDQGIEITPILDTSKKYIKKFKKQVEIEDPYLSYECPACYKATKQKEKFCEKCKIKYEKKE